ncbi:MAG: hypothetical protein WKF40_05155 [Thermoleophilaceae bacterium]
MPRRAGPIRTEDTPTRRAMHRLRPRGAGSPGVVTTPVTVSMDTV